MSTTVTCPICGTQAEKNIFCPTCHWFLVGALDAVSLSPIPQADLDAINASLKAYRESWQQGRTLCHADAQKQLQSLTKKLDTANQKIKKLEKKLSAAPEDLSGQVADLTAELEAAKAKIAELEALPVKVDRPSLFKKSDTYTNKNFEVVSGVLKQYKGSGGKATVPKGVHTIATAAFGNAKVDMIYLPDSVTTIEGGAFSHCTAQQIRLSANLTTLEPNAFISCSRLTSIELPEKIRHIPDYAFHCCFSLRKVTLPFYLETIGKEAFAHCQSIQELTVPHAVKQIGPGAFFDCGVLSKLPHDTYLTLHLPAHLSGNREKYIR